MKRRGGKRVQLRVKNGKGYTEKRPKRRTQKRKRGSIE